MISITKIDDVIRFTFSNSQRYPYGDGTIDVPVNSLSLVTDSSDMATFRKAATNDIFISGLYSEFGKTKAELETYFKENMVSTGGGGGGTSYEDEFKGIIDKSITEANIPSGVTTIGDYAFQNCTSLSSVTIPNSVTSIGNYAFRYCSSLSSITIPNSVTSIGSDAFYYCRSLTSITIPNSVTEIGDRAFNECFALTSVTIGSGVTEIGNYAFRYCSSLSNFTVNATTPPTLGSWIFGEASDDLVIYVPADSIDAYKSADGWSTYSDRIQAITS